MSSPPTWSALPRLLAFQTTRTRHPGLRPYQQQTLKVCLVPQPWSGMSRKSANHFKISQQIFFEILSHNFGMVLTTFKIAVTIFKRSATVSREVCHYVKKIVTILRKFIMIFDFETRMLKLGSLRHPVPGFSTIQTPNCVVSSVSSVLGREVGEGKSQRKNVFPPVFSISPKQVWRRNPEIFQKPWASTPSKRFFRIFCAKPVLKNFKEAFGHNKKRSFPIPDLHLRIWAREIRPRSELPMHLGGRNATNILSVVKTLEWVIVQICQDVLVCEI